MDQIVETLLAAAGGSVFDAVISTSPCMFDEPLRAIVGIAASKEIESFKGQLSEQLNR